MSLDQIKVIAFDADDTLWVNEPLFQQTEQKFCDMLEEFLPSHTVSRELLQVEIANMRLYGYGIKAFMLSMIETAIKVTAGNIKPDAITRIIELGKEILDAPVELIDGVEDVLKTLNGNYRVIMATKGDLLDQERKLFKSGLAKYFPPHRDRIRKARGRIPPHHPPPRRRAASIPDGWQFIEVRYTAHIEYWRPRISCAVSHHVGVGEGGCGD